MKPSQAFDHAFDAEIVRHFMGTNARGNLYYTVVFLPLHLTGALPGGGPLRITGEVAEMPVQGALMPTAGRRYFMIPRDLMRERGLNVGETVEVRFSLADRDALELPDELRLAIHAEAEVVKAWDALTPGRKRGLAYRVASAKRSETRTKRVDEIVAALRDGRDPMARR